MADVTIPQLPPTDIITQDMVIPIDTGVQTFKITTPNFGKNIRPYLYGPTPAAKTADYTLSLFDGLIPFDSSGGSFNLFLPNPASFPNQSYRIADVGAAANSFPITLKRFASENISGLAQDYLLEAQDGVWEVFSDGTNWYML